MVGGAGSGQEQDHSIQHSVTLSLVALLSWLLLMSILLNPGRPEMGEQVTENRWEGQRQPRTQDQVAPVG